MSQGVFEGLFWRTSCRLGALRGRQVWGGGWWGFERTGSRLRAFFGRQAASGRRPRSRRSHGHHPVGPSLRKAVLACQVRLGGPHLGLAGHLLVKAVLLVFGWVEGSQVGRVGMEARVGGWRGAWNIVLGRASEWEGGQGETTTNQPCLSPLPSALTQRMCTTSAAAQGINVQSHRTVCTAAAAATRVVSMPWQRAAPTAPSAAPTAAPQDSVVRHPLR